MSAAFTCRTRKPPPAAAFFAPSGLSSSSLLRLLVYVANDLISTYSNSSRWPRQQRMNARRLLRRIQNLLTFFEFLLNFHRPVPRLGKLCLKEFYIAIHRSRFLLDFCFQSSRLWLILRNQMISDQFHEIEREFSTLLDVFPLNELCLSSDVRELVELLRRQVGNSRRYSDSGDDVLRVRLMSFLTEFEQQKLPDTNILKLTFVDQIGIADAGNFDSEIEFLLEQSFIQQDSDGDVDASTISGVIAVARYSKFILFGVQETEKGKMVQKKRPASNVISVPKDFCCPISLELMSDPVAVSTGMTYDRSSITQWMSSGHQTCPNSGQKLVSTQLVPNRVMHSLISHWCHTNGTNTKQGNISTSVPAAAPKSAVEATRAVARILIQNLSFGDLDSKIVAALELHFLSNVGKESRAMIAEEGAIPFLSLLLHSQNPNAQENAVRAILNLSTFEANKRKIINQEGCLRSIVAVLRRGLTQESRENAAAVLFSISILHDYKKLIVNEPGGAEALAWLLRYGRTTGKKDAVMALFNLSMHPESGERMLDSGAVAALVSALEEELVAEVAAGALALLTRRPAMARLVDWHEKAVIGLTGVMRTGSSVGRENAAAALHEICRRGGTMVEERVAKVPGIAGFVHSVALDRTKRMRMKAAALPRMIQRRLVP